jgi:hypothetical protein
MMDMYSQMISAVVPIKITNLYLFSDSSISLSWVRGRIIDFTKIEKKTIFLNNRLASIIRSCEVHSVNFRHVSGLKNPADILTRCISPNLLARSGYLTGVTDYDWSLFNVDSHDFMSFSVPNPLSAQCNIAAISVTTPDILFPLEKYSSFHFMCKIVTVVYSFIGRLKSSLFKKDPIKFSKYKDSHSVDSFALGRFYILHASQFANYNDVLLYLNGDSPVCPSVINRLNLFVDTDGLIHTNCKFKRLQATFSRRCPILLHPDCHITSSIIMDAHSQLSHGNTYRILHYLKQDFWIPKIYSIVKKNLAKCLWCKKLYGRTVKINTNDYTATRVDPTAIPFRNLLLDYIGPFSSKSFDSKPQKIYILILTCYWSQAINLLVCDSLETGAFLRALQLHIYAYGIPSKIISDNGSQIVQGLQLLQSVLHSPDVLNFCGERDISLFYFSPYPAGTSRLGGAVEALVKQVKILLKGCCGPSVLPLRDFEFFVSKVNMLINKRPVAYKYILTDNNNVDSFLDTCLTPERLLKGFDVPSLSILPPLTDSDDPDFLQDSAADVWASAFKSSKKFEKVHVRLREIYYPEFLSNLEHQASDRPIRYRPHSHIRLDIGDLVTLKEKFCKPFDYPLALVAAVEMNSLDEVNVVTVRKSNGSHIRRHVEDVILILKGAVSPESLTVPNIDDAAVNNIQSDATPLPNRIRRAAAIRCDQRNRLLSI